MPISKKFLGDQLIEVNEKYRFYWKKLLSFNEINTAIVEQIGELIKEKKIDLIESKSKLALFNSVKEERKEIAKKLTIFINENKEIRKSFLKNTLTVEALEEKDFPSNYYKIIQEIKDVIAHVKFANNAKLDYNFIRTEYLTEIFSLQYEVKKFEADAIHFRTEIKEFKTYSKKLINEIEATRTFKVDPILDEEYARNAGLVEAFELAWKRHNELFDELMLYKKQTVIWTIEK